MKYIITLREGDRLSDVYLCKYKQSAMTRNGKQYYNCMLQDKTGVLEAKVWEPDSGAIADFEIFDYIYVMGDVTRYQGALQASLKRVQVARPDEYITSDYLPVSPLDNDAMYKELLSIIETVKNTYLHQLLRKFFAEDKEFAEKFRRSSAAKTVHHSFVGGLMHHTLSVCRLCKYYTKAYPVLNHDLLITSALLHDVGKVKELSSFPRNDYTDEGQLIGHIVIGIQMVEAAASGIEGFPEKLRVELEHCIAAHHGEYEYGSPKKPALAEAVALNFADNTDAKLETFTELLDAARTANTPDDAWLGYNKFFESNIRRAGRWS